MNLPFAGFVHSKRMESGSVSNFDRLAFGLLVLTYFLSYLIELALSSREFSARYTPPSQNSSIA